MIDARERPLRDQPDRFDEIFGNAKFPTEAVRKLMAAVALIVVKDYFVVPDKIKNPAARARAIADRTEAEQYIFDGRRSVEFHVFSFGSICKSLEIDPAFARRGIRKRSPEQIRGIVQRIACHRADWDDD